METTIIILTVINVIIVALVILRVGTVLLNRIDNLANHLSNSLRHNLSNLDIAAQLRGSDTSNTLIKMTKHLDSISATIQTLSENVNSITIDIKNITTKRSATNVALDNLTKDISDINSRTANMAADILGQYKIIVYNNDFLNNSYPTINDISERVSTHSKYLEAITRSTIINNRKLDDVVDFINDFKAAAKDLASKASEASNEGQPYEVVAGGTIIDFIDSKSIREDKDDRDVDNDSDDAKAKEEKWLTNEFLDNLEYVTTSNPRGNCKNCALSLVCNDPELRDEVAKSEDVRIRTRGIIRGCLNVNGYYIKKDKEKSSADKAKELRKKLKAKAKSDRNGSAESNNS